MNKAGKICLGVFIPIIIFIIVFLFLIFIPYSNNLDQYTYTVKEKLGPYKQTIPKKIHQIWTGEKMPKKFKKIQKHLQKQNPEYTYHLYNEEQMDNFVKIHFPQYYKSYSLIAPEYIIAKCDFFRYMIIYHFGGVYFDMKSGAKKPLREIIKSDDEMVIPVWNNIGKIFPRIDTYAQWVIIAKPQHPCLKKILDGVNNRLEQAINNKNIYGWYGVFTLTGPLMFNTVVKENKNKIKNITYIAQPNDFVYNYLEKNDADHLACTLYSSTGLGFCNHKTSKKRYTLHKTPVVQSNPKK